MHWGEKKLFFRDNERNKIRIIEENLQGVYEHFGCISS